MCKNVILVHRKQLELQNFATPARKIAKNRLKTGSHDPIFRSNYYSNHTPGKLLDSDWLRDCEFIRNLRANSVIRGKLQISRAKSVIHSECKYEKRINDSQLMINDQ